jgi:predicted DCC family thiol-disulfide oxidoreductase YuxK
LKAQHDKPIVLFDGVCNYCNARINFIINQDKRKTFFCNTSIKCPQRILKQWGLPVDSFESFLILDKGKLCSESTAALRLYNKLPWYWKWTQSFRIFPKFIRDWVYNIIAKNQYKSFGKKGLTRGAAPELKERYLN